MKKIITVSLLICLSVWQAPAQNTGNRAGSTGTRPLPHGVSVNLHLCTYNGAVMAEKPVFLEGRLERGGSVWTSSVTGREIPGTKDAIDLEITFRLEKGSAGSSGVAVAFDIENWSPANYVMIPASVYNGNRNRVVDRSYASGLDRSDLYRPDLPLTTGPLPQLSPVEGLPSEIAVSTCNATTPAVCFYSQGTGRGFILLAGQGIRRGGRMIDNGLFVTESADRTRATIMVTAPGVRPRKPEFVGFSESPDRGIDWKAGDSVTMKLRLYSFETAGIAGLLDRFMTVRKSLTGPNRPRNLMPFSESSRVMTENIDSRFYNKDPYRFYCPENADWISFGWVGGLMNTYPMLAHGDDEHLRRVASTFDFAIPRAQGRAGYFYGALNFDGKCFGREGYDEFPWITLTRKNGDVLYWMVRQFGLAKAMGREDFVKPEWEMNIRRLAEAFAATWKTFGQWGNFLNIDTGQVAVYNTTSGASAIGGMVLAAEYFGEPRYLEIAREAAEYYYDHDFTALGMTTGACADILQNADSESAAALMNSLMVLYERTGDRKWLEKSRNVANLLATWVVSYDYELPPETELGGLGAKLAGAVWASTQNKHGAPGLCTSSGDALFKIFRGTGDPRYADLLYDIVHAWAEGVQPDGRISERLTYCDADSRGSRGTGWKTGWNELNGILMAMELPGIYVQTDRDVLRVFDHVSARVVSRSAKGVELEITNPTRYDAEVSVMVESSARSKKPMDGFAFPGWEKIRVMAGETVRGIVTSDE